MESSRPFPLGVLALTVAVLTGVAETVIAVTGFQRSGEFPPGWQIQLGVRALIYTGLLVLLIRTWRANRVPAGQR